MAVPQTRRTALPYQQQISRDYKACILFLIDQSYSMVEPLGNSARRKCDELISAVNVATIIGSSIK